MGAIHTQSEVSFLYLPFIFYCRAKLNNSGDKTSPCLKPFSVGKLEDK